MRRKLLAPEELNEIIRLHEAGNSWLMIQKLTGIPRRTAQKEYKRWESSRSTERLDSVRQEVAAEEFRRHIDVVTEFAGVLISHLTISEESVPDFAAERYLLLLWDKEISRLSELYRASWGGPRGEDRTRRRNLMVFSSLQAHTKDAVNWKALDRWRQSWDNCRALLARVTDSVARELTKVLTTFPEMGEGTSPGGAKGTAIEILTKNITRGMWQYLVRRDADTTSYIVRVSKSVSGGEQKGVIEILGRTVLQYGSLETAGKIADAARTVMHSHLKQGDADALRSEIRLMQKVVADLEGLLDPMALRPVLLRTKCVLCPV